MSIKEVSWEQTLYLPPNHQPTEAAQAMDILETSLQAGSCTPCDIQETERIRTPASKGCEEPTTYFPDWHGIATSELPVTHPENGRERDRVDKEAKNCLSSPRLRVRCSHILGFEWVL